MTQVLKIGTAVRFMIVVLFLFLAAGVVLQSGPTRNEINGQVGAPVKAQTETSPPDALIDDFDKEIQKRFLTMPSFGMGRLVTVRPGPSNPHLVQFNPETHPEQAAVTAFADRGWNVGMYLFGRKVTRRASSKKEKYDIRYRLFNPITVTAEENYPAWRDSKQFAEAIKEAFVEFQKPGSPNENEVRFDSGKWSYVARPVRAVNQSCLQCHKDYVITERLGDGKFTARERRIGDANGVLVYAFTRRKEQSVARHD